MVGYVYVLHFDRKLHHAEHYVGCTVDPRGRWITHAQGRGARIVRAMLDADGEFRVGAVGTTHQKGLRRIERNLKNWHNASQFCEVCNPEAARRIPGTQPYPLDAMPFPLHSAALRELERTPGEVTIRFTSQADTIDFASRIQRIMRAEKDALGFIPAGGDAGLTGSIGRGRIVVTVIDGIPVGYCAFTEPLDQSIVRIHQCCVNDAYRGCGFGRRMVEMVARSRPNVTLQAKVRDDLVANEFWKAIGFTQVGFEHHDTSGAVLNIYRRGNAAEGKSAA